MSHSGVLLPVIFAAAVLAQTHAQARAPVQEEAPDAGFDCLKASTPGEMLICSDPRLLTLDSKLAKVLAVQASKAGEPQRAQAAAQQRDWMKDALKRCNVPAKGELSHEVQWRAAPCLDEAYRNRLAGLGVAPEPESASVAASREPGFIHPNCLLPIIEDEPEAAPRTDPRIPLEACARGNRHIPVTEGEEGGFSAQAASEGNSTWLTYKPIGRLNDGREAVIVWYTSGGDTEYSQIYLLRRSPSPDGRETLLTGEPLGDSGEGCSGGIERAELINGSKLQVDYRVTPQDLLAEGDEQIANESIDALAFCDVCCTGSVRHIVDPTNRQETTVSATVDELLSDDKGAGAGDEGEEAQACFDGLVRKAAGGTLPHTFQASEIKTLSAAFAKQCLKH